jgi:hypothetical protein
MPPTYPQGSRLAGSALKNFMHLVGRQSWMDGELKSSRTLKTALGQKAHINALKGPETEAKLLLGTVRWSLGAGLRPSQQLPHRLDA